MEHTLELLFTVLIAVIGSNGLWAFIQSRSSHKSARDKMTLGLGHAKIQQLSERYMLRGGITADELDDLVHYLYEPYKEMGGNGSGEVMIQQVKQLPIIPPEEATRRDGGIVYKQVKDRKEAEERHES